MRKLGRVSSLVGSAWGRRPMAASATRTRLVRCVTPIVCDCVCVTQCQAVINLQPSGSLSLRR
jgi:hypothetical protein